MNTVEDTRVMAALTEAAERVSAGPMPFDRLPRVHALARRRRRVRAAGSAAVVAALLGGGALAVPHEQRHAAPLPGSWTEPERVEFRPSLRWDAAAREAVLDPGLSGFLHQYVDIHTFQPLDYAQVWPLQLDIDWGDGEWGGDTGARDFGGCSTQTPLRPLQPLDPERHQYAHPGHYVVRIEVWVCSDDRPRAQKLTITVP